MVILGLTGSIGMGKSTVAARLRERGLPVLDADAVVHDLYKGAAVAPIEVAFPGSTVAGCVDRSKLSALLVADPKGFEQLEAIVHPLVRKAERDFLHAHAAAHVALAVLEIPLLFETGGEKLVDATLVASAPSHLQRDRVLARPGMTAQKLDAIIARQLSDEQKRARADFVVDTGGTLAATYARLDAILDAVRGLKARAFDAVWR